MRNKLGYVLCLMATLCLLGGMNSPVSANPIEVGFLDFPPFYVVKSPDQVQGIMYDMITDVLKRAGVAYSVKGYPPIRLYRNIASGKTQLWGGTKGVPYYDGKVLYSEDKIMAIDLRAYTKALPVVSGIQDLAGEEVAVIKGYGYAGYVEFFKDPANHIALHELIDRDAMFHFLEHKPAVYAIDYAIPFEKTLQKMKDTQIKSSTIATIDIFFVLSKSTPGAPELMDRLESALGDLKAEGKLDPYLR